MNNILKIAAFRYNFCISMKKYKPDSAARGTMVANYTNSWPFWILERSLSD
jgi:hypothetical protein